MNPLGSFPVPPPERRSEKPSECPAIEVAPSSFDVNSIFTTPPSMISHFSGSADSSEEVDFFLAQNEGDDRSDDEEDDDDFANFDDEDDDEADDLTLLHAQHIPMPQPAFSPASPKSKLSVIKGIRKSLGRIQKGFVWRNVTRKQLTRRMMIQQRQQDDDTYSKPEFTSVDSFNLSRFGRLRIHLEEWMQPRRKRVNRLVYHAAEDITEDEVHSTSELSSSSALSENEGPLKVLSVYPFTCASF
jgi:hypothetical protein